MLPRSPGVFRVASTPSSQLRVLAPVHLRHAGVCVQGGPHTRLAFEGVDPRAPAAWGELLGCCWVAVLFLGGDFPGQCHDMVPGQCHDMVPGQQVPPGCSAVFHSGRHRVPLSPLFGIHHTPACYPSSRGIGGPFSPQIEVTQVSSHAHLGHGAHLSYAPP